MGKLGLAHLVSALPPAGAVPATPIQFSHDEPIVLWRMQRPGGLLCHSVIRPRSNGALVVWFINGRPLGFREFVDWKSALRWSDQLQAQNWVAGWRPASD
jgi:hypothetical protein